MSIEILSKDNKRKKEVFLIKNKTPAFVNALRRTIISLVPTMAINEVEFVKNSSALYDEIVANRLGLIPLKTDLSSYELPSKCSCKGEGCAKCTLKIKLSAKGPCTVYAKDLVSTDPKVKPAFPDMPIVKLLERQEIEFVATATLGIGLEHSKWSPGHVYYKGVPKIEIKGKCENPKAISDICPKNIFKVNSGKLDINENKVMDCSLCLACSNICESINITASNKDFCFSVESFGQLEIKEMMEKASEIIAEIGDDLKKSL
jgi:DNA-directed RNA polymerase subunit D